MLFPHLDFQVRAPPLDNGFMTLGKLLPLSRPQHSPPRKWESQALLHWDIGTIQGDNISARLGIKKAAMNVSFLAKTFMSHSHPHCAQPALGSLRDRRKHVRVGQSLEVSDCPEFCFNLCCQPAVWAWENCFKLSEHHFSIKRAKKSTSPRRAVRSKWFSMSKHLENQHSPTLKGSWGTKNSVMICLPEELKRGQLKTEHSELSARTHI